MLRLLVPNLYTTNPKTFEQTDEKLKATNMSITANFYQSSADILEMPDYHHLLFTSVGFANRRPRLTVTRLCKSTVLMSNGRRFCCKVAVVPPAVGIGGAPAATWLCSPTLVVAGASAVIAPFPEATIVTPAPAAEVVDPASRPSVVKVAESIDTDVLDEEACCTPGGTSPPAEIVIADATVCRVFPGAGSIDPS